MNANIHKVSAMNGGALIAARTVDEVERAIEGIEAELGSVVWRPLDDTERNNGSVELGRNSATQLIERVVNGQEACLELMAATTGEVPATPYEAAQRWFGVPKGGLAAMSDSAVRTLAEGLVAVTLVESGVPQNPTVVVADQGIGRHPVTFPMTLLGLHRSDKGDKPYLWGQYGHGGATTLMYSPYTIIASRAAPIARQGLADLVGLTVVRYRPGRIRGGTYEYLTGQDGGLGAILAIEPSDAPEPFRSTHGTQVVHVAYELSGYAAAYRLQKTGLWALINASLFDAVLPVVMRGTRDADLYGDPRAGSVGRIAKGNVAILAGLRAAASLGDPEQAMTGPLRYDDETILSVGDAGEHGTIRVRLWVLPEAGKIESYVRADQSVTLTLSGQRQGREGREFLKGCRLGFLSKRMIVQVAADGLTAEAKRQLFPSGREDQREGPMAEVVRAALGEYLQGHKDLAALEEEARSEDLAKVAGSVRDGVRRRVARLIQQTLRGAGGPRGRAAGAQVLGSRGGLMGRQPRFRVEETDDSGLPAIPTTLAIEGSKSTIRAGRSGQIVLRLNAKNGFLDANADALRVEIVGGTKRVRVKGRGTLRGGRARLLLGTGPDTPAGEYTVRVSVAVPGDGELTAVTTIRVVPDVAVKGGQAVEEGGLPDIRWLRHPDEATNDEDRQRCADAWPSEWERDEVGDVLTSSAALVIRLNESYDPLRDAVRQRSSGSRASLERVEGLKDRYAAAVGYGLWLLSRPGSGDPGKAAPAPDLKQARQALARVQLEVNEAVAAAGEVGEPVQLTA